MRLTTLELMKKHIIVGAEITIKEKPRTYSLRMGANPIIAKLTYPLTGIVTFRIDHHHYITFTLEGFPYGWSSGSESNKGFNKINFGFSKEDFQQIFKI